MTNRWLSASVDADPIERARMLRRAQEAVFNGKGRPSILREIVLDSWLRSAEAGVDPTRPAPRIISERDAAERLSSHPLGAIVPILRTMLGGVAREARHIVVISDAHGMLLSAEGHPEMLEAAESNHFLPGALVSEIGRGDQRGRHHAVPGPPAADLRRRAFQQPVPWLDVLGRAGPRPVHRRPARRDRPLGRLPDRPPAQRAARRDGGAARGDPPGAGGRPSRRLTCAIATSRSSCATRAARARS